MRVVVLMSTYQGERFVGEQLRSILDRLPPEGRIVIRDDGSTDGTVRCIASFGDGRVSVEAGANVGYARSFFWLLEHAPADAELILLCDQDDVWLPERIDRAWAALEGAGDTAMLYCSRLRIVDAQLRPLGLSPQLRGDPSFANALTENIVTGCTAALNPAALRLALRGVDPSRIGFHDWWLYLVVAAFGRVIYDAQPTVLYRQHGSNVIGMGSGLARYRAMVRFLRSRNWVHIMFAQIEHFRALHARCLDPEKRSLLDRYFDPHDWRAVARLLFAARRFQQSVVGEALFRGLLLACIASGKGLLPRAPRD
jgi:glycosyltransferase involved in cell wall biosynthesis